MSLSVYNLKKWIKMLSGKSILHVEQDVGKIYSIDKIKGYYNDLTEKVKRDKEINEVKIPLFEAHNVEKVYFPINIFQYGLGAYDLYLLEKNKLYFDKFILCARWALDNQNDDGSWNAFFFIYPDRPYSSMAQGEGASLLLRAYIELNDEKFLTAAQKAVDFMLLSEEDGGTARYQENDIYLLEVTKRPVIMNGWIFSLFGLFDIIKVTNDRNYIDIFNKSVKTLVNHLANFDTGYWSKYDSERMLASEFYHKLHIAQLRVMHEITGESACDELMNKWIEYLNRPTNRLKAFIVKAFQKILEK
jgi:heparosan-N-sulfate-glucuronate 5-epimerase